MSNDPLSKPKLALPEPDFPSRRDDDGAKDGDGRRMLTAIERMDAAVRGTDSPAADEPPQVTGDEAPEEERVPTVSGVVSRLGRKLLPSMTDFGAPARSRPTPGVPTVSMLEKLVGALAASVPATPAPAARKQQEPPPPALMEQPALTPAVAVAPPIEQPAQPPAAISAQPEPPQPEAAAPAADAAAPPEQASSPSPEPPAPAPAALFMPEDLLSSFKRMDSVPYLPPEVGTAVIFEPKPGAPEAAAAAAAEPPAAEARTIEVKTAEVIETKSDVAPVSESIANNAKASEPVAATPQPGEAESKPASEAASEPAPGGQPPQAAVEPAAPAAITLDPPPLPIASPVAESVAAPAADEPAAAEPAAAEPATEEVLVTEWDSQLTDRDAIAPHAEWAPAAEWSEDSALVPDESDAVINTSLIKAAPERSFELESRTDPAAFLMEPQRAMISPESDSPASALMTHAPLLTSAFTQPMTAPVHAAPAAAPIAPAAPRPRPRPIPAAPAVPADPLAPLKAMSDEEKIALFS